MSELCGDLFPDEPAPDGKPITCHLDQNHGGLWHSWWHELHVGNGESFGAGNFAWPTTLGYAAMGDEPLAPSVVRLALPFVGPHGLVTHEVVQHPKMAMLHANKPAKPVR
ncbi:MAG TPA: hypothetical protein VIJ31_12180 [Acidothermaceae bacterium]